MKKVISLIIALCLVFGSFSFVLAADWSTTDSSNLQSIKNTLTNTTGGTIYYMISQINAAMRFSNKTIANWLSDIESELSNTLWYVDGDTSRSISWWVKEAVLDLDQLVDTGSGTLLYYVQTLNTNVNTILTRTNSILTNMGNIDQNIAFIQGDTGNIVTSFTTLLGYQVGILGHQNNIDTTLNTSVGNNSFMIWNSTADSNWTLYDWNVTGTPLQALFGGLRMVNRNIIYGFHKQITSALNGYATTQTAKDWNTLNNKTFSPSSAVNGIYTWLQNIQEPVARLSYVHASDEEIEAREKAAANTEAVVDNFVDSSGAGSVSTSDIGSLSSAAGSYKTNASTGASATGVWSVFDQSNYNWFSQTTANNLDTSANTRKAAAHYDTPLLDSYYSYMTDYLKENPDD